MTLSEAHAILHDVTVGEPIASMEDANCVLMDLKTARRDFTEEEYPTELHLQRLAALATIQLSFTGPPPGSLAATAESPITIYYCKAGIPTGQTVRVSHGRSVTACQGVRLHCVSGTMLHGNSTGKAKASGARCVLQITAGTISIIP